MADEVSRGEFDLLKQMVAGLDSRISDIDAHGTRGIGILTTRIDEVVKDVASMQADMIGKFDALTKQRELERKERISGRRWLIGTGVAGVASMSAVITLLVEVLRHVH